MARPLLPVCLPRRRDLHRGIERRERVWIRRFLAHRGKRNLFARMEEIILRGGPDQLELKALFERAANELSTGEKRRFIYNLAQRLRSAFPARRLLWVTKLGATIVVLAVFFGLATTGVVSASPAVAAACGAAYHAKNLPWRW